MASSFTDDQLTLEENIREIVRDKLQKVLNDQTESTQSEELLGPTTTNNTNFENLVLSDNIDDTNNAPVRNSNLSSLLRRAIDAYDESFGLAERRLLSTGNSPNTSPGSDTVNANGQKIQRHIFISYNRESASDICTQLYDKLHDLGYEVWMDVHNLHGKILNAMAKGVQDSYIVLICYNDKYSESDFCEIEATYAFTRCIDLIPCRLQASYKPDGWLGSIVSTRNYIDFSPPNDFEKTFNEKLIPEIKFITIHPQTNRNPLAIQRSADNNFNMQMYKERMREQFDATIDEFKQTINKSDDDLQSLTKEELCQLVRHIKERLFSDNLSISETNNDEQRNRNDNQMIHNLIGQAQNQTELLQKITDILSNPTDFRTVMKLALLFLFIWTVKTRIIDAFIKHQ